MEIIARISKGSKMDQIYIQKDRYGFNSGDYVVVKPLETKEIIEKPHFYGVRSIEPIKLKLIEEIFNIVDKKIKHYENIIITGSFLDKGFRFNDVDVVLVSKEKISVKDISDYLEKFLGVKVHIILLDNRTLMNGLAIDPLYQLMMSKCVSKKRLIYKTEYKIDYKILDIQLLKSRVLIDNFDVLDGNEKYYLTRNMVAIYLYLKFRKITKEKVDDKIRQLFGLKNTDEIKNNMLEKNTFLRKYKEIYKKTFDVIMKNVKQK